MRAFLSLSLLINIIGSVIEWVSVYWHTVSFTSGSSYFLDAYFFTLLHHNHNLTSNNVFIDMFHVIFFMSIL